MKAIVNMPNRNLKEFRSQQTEAEKPFLVKALARPVVLKHRRESFFKREGGGSAGQIQKP